MGDAPLYPSRLANGQGLASPPTLHDLQMDKSSGPPNPSRLANGQEFRPPPNLHDLQMDKRLGPSHLSRLANGQGTFYDLQMDKGLAPPRSRVTTGCLGFSQSVLQTHFPWGSDTFGIEKALARAIRAARWGRIAGQDSGSHLKEGIDWTVPRSIVKEGNRGSTQLCFCRTAWQGALLTSAKGSPMCPTCKVQVDLQHILYDCTWWDSQKMALPKHWAEIRKRLPYPSLWCRGLMPGIATDHPQCEYGEASIVRTGLWLSQPKICAQGHESRQPLQRPDQG